MVTRTKRKSLKERTKLDTTMCQEGMSGSPRSRAQCPYLCCQSTVGVTQVTVMKGVGSQLDREHDVILTSSHRSGDDRGSAWMLVDSDGPGGGGSTQLRTVMMESCRSCAKSPPEFLKGSFRAALRDLPCGKHPYREGVWCPS